ncbi:MAG: hypothetical protein ACYTE8_08895 [Planctomycetota bacterium]|jgi:hypothetical protein
MASLYAEGANSPPTDANLVLIEVRGPLEGGVVCFDITIEAIRGGVIDENLNSLAIDVHEPLCFLMVTCCEYPDCWDYPTQCYGDATGDGFVDTSDWPYFRDSFFKSFPDSNYLPCGDYNRDGIVNTEDWPEFRDNFFSWVPDDCTPGDINGVYCP